MQAKRRDEARKARSFHDRPTIDMQGGKTRPAPIPWIACELGEGLEMGRRGKNRQDSYSSTSADVATYLGGKEVSHVLPEGTPSNCSHKEDAPYHYKRFGTADRGLKKS